MILLFVVWAFSPSEAKEKATLNLTSWLHWPSWGWEEWGEAHCVMSLVPLDQERNTGGVRTERAGKREEPKKSETGHMRVKLQNGTGLEGRAAVWGSVCGAGAEERWICSRPTSKRRRTSQPKLGYLESYRKK